MSKKNSTDPSANIESVYPLSPMQEGMLFYTLLRPSSGIYLMQNRYRLEGDLRPEAFAQGWQRVAERHPVLRTSFAWKSQKRPLQVVHKQVELPFDSLDLRGLGEAAQEAHIAQLLRRELEEGFDFGKAPLTRFRLIRLGERVYEFVHSFHHILLDEWCTSLLMVDFLAYYESIVLGVPPSLPPARPYRDYIDWLSRQDQASAEAFWRGYLRGFSNPTPLGLDEARASSAGGSGEVEDVVRRLSPGVTAKLSALAQRHRLTLNTLVQGAWALLLSRYGGEADVVFGVTVAGRPPELPGVETIVGLFINTVPLRVSVPAEQPLVPWLKGLQGQNLLLRQYGHTPLVNVQGYSEVERGRSLFQSLFVFENAPIDPALREGKIAFRVRDVRDRVHTNYPITIMSWAEPELPLKASFDRSAVPPDAAFRMLGHLGALLEGMAERPDARLGELSLLTPGERRLALVDWNPAPPARTDLSSYAARFRAQAARTPDAVAASCGGRRLTYAELDRGANRLAHALAARGVGPESRVALLDARGLELLTMIVAVFKAGGAYVPLSVDDPEGRMARALASSGASVLLTREGLLGRAEEAVRLAGLERPPAIVALEGLPEGGPDHDLPDRGGGGDLAYIIYTSGSTGVPKGAMVERRGMLNNMLTKVPRLSLEPGDVIAQTASPCFDISVWQFLTAPLFGGAVEIIPDDIAKDPARLLDHVEGRGIAVLEIVPAVLKGMLEAARERATPPSLRKLRWVLPTGEALPAALAREWLTSYPAVPLMNAYGPAECSDDVALHPLTEPPAPQASQVPIGRPVEGLRLYVLDRLLDPAPVGVCGEIYVGGVGVGRGYAGDALRTAGAFVPDPFGDEPGGRLYRTGDLARTRADGALEFVGRRDHQVKLRGFRIELGEIEARLAEHPSVREAVAVVREDRPGSRRLVAYVGAAGQAPDVGELSAWLEARLPEYMVPRSFVFLPALPRTPNGKPDRKALPAPELGASDFVAPRTETEASLAAVWAEVLGLSRVSADDSFFDLGGHSLLLTQIAARIRRVFEVEVPLRELFETPTVASQARAVDAARGAGPSASAPPLVPRPRGGATPLSFAQERLWFLAELEPTAASYNVPAAVRLRGPLDTARLGRAFFALALRHESLRTGFVEAEGKPAAVVRAEQPVELATADVSRLAPEGREAEARRLAEEYAGRPFDLKAGPLLRALVVELGDSEHLLLIVLHHIVSDGWSMNVLVREVTELYAAEAEGRSPDLAPLPLQYADYAQWQREWLAGPALERQLAHWRGKLGGDLPVLSLPADRPRPEARSYRGARHVFTLPEGLSAGLRALARERGVTPFVLLLACFKALLARTSGQNDLCVGTPVANRTRVEVEGLIGFFANTLVIRTKLEQNEPFLALVTRVRDEVVEAQAHQDLPFERLVQALRPARNLSHTPLFQAMFSLAEAPSRGPALAGLEVEPFEIDPGSAQFDLSLHMALEPGGLLGGTFEYSTDLFEGRTVRRLAGALQTLLEGVVARPFAPLAELPLPAPPEAPKPLEAPARAAGEAPRAAQPPASAEPRTPEEAHLVQIWAEVLGRGRVGIYDNFFELGGDSILSLQVVARAKKAGLSLTARQMFQYQTLAELAAAARPAAAEGEGAPSGPVTGDAPLSPIQRQFFARGLSNPHHWNQALLLITPEPLALPAFEAAARALVRHHDALRLRYLREAGQWRQTHAADDQTVLVYKVDLSSIGEAGRREALEAHAARWQASLDLGAGPLFRAVWFDLGAGRPGRLLLAAHHLVVDGVSWRIILEDLQAAYDQALRGEPVALPDKTASFKQWAERLSAVANDQTFEKEAAFWLGLPWERVLDLPVDDPSAGRAEGTAATILASLDEAETRTLLGVSAEAGGAKIEEILLAALASALSTWAGQGVAAIEVEGHGREELGGEELDLSRTVGWFTSAFPVVVELAPNAKPAEALGAVKAQLRRMPRRGLPYGAVCELGRGPTAEQLRTLPRAAISFNYLGQWDTTLGRGARFALAEESPGPERDPENELPYEIAVDAAVYGGRFEASLVYGGARYRRETVEALGGLFRDALKAIVAHAASPGEGAYTPADFPDVELLPQELDAILSQMSLGTRAGETIGTCPMADKDIEAIYYLAPIQQGLLFHAVEGGESDPYFNQAVFRLDGALDPDAFERAWQAAVGRHPILRTAFAWQGVAKPVQIVRRRAIAPVAHHDLRGKGGAERDAALHELLEADRRAGFNFLKPPLMRLSLVRIEENAWYFINSHHHILLDGWSLALLLREALVTYHALARGTVPELPRPRPYRDYVAWVQARDEGAAERFFRGALAGLRSPTPLPLATPPGPAPGPNGAGLSHAEQELRLTPEQTGELAAFCRRQRITLNTLVQGVWALLLARHSGEGEVVFGATVSGRPPELSGSDAIVGVLINSLPVRASVRDDVPLSAWLRELQDKNSELRQYEWAPLTSVRRWGEMPGGKPLFESLVVFDSYPEEAPEVTPNGLRVSALSRPGPREGSAVLGAGRNNYPLSLIVEPSEALRLILCYERSRLSHDAAARLLGQCHTIVRAMLSRPDARLGELPLVDGAERRRLLVELNATDVERPDGRTLHALFEEQARRRPDAVAVVCENESLAYRELDRRANQVARRLLALGVGREDRVVLCVERSVGLIAGLLGILKAGGAYVPVDTKYPAERLRAVADDSGAKAIVTQGPWAAAFEGQGAAVLCLDRDENAVASEDGGQVKETTTPACLAYIIYTSGSTGRPKGVAVEHRQLVHYVRGVLERLKLGEGASFAFASTAAADLGHTSLFGALCSGGALHVLSNERTFDPDATAEYMSRHGVDALKIVPSHLKALLEASRPERVLPRRCLVLGGEASSRGLVEKVRSLRPGCQIINHYGPTEATVGALTHDVSGDAGEGAIPVGRPLANVRAYVLGPNFEPVPAGVVGELYIGGEGIARGYHGRPGQTAERFLPDPFAKRPGGRLYRTGDRARHRADGAIEFLGRVDHQIKLRGYRIELGEIEARLRELPGVRDAVVAVRDAGGTERLAAYVVAPEGESASPAGLLEALSKRLPDYMVPSYVVALEALPLTANGKIDRAALPSPEPGGGAEGGGYVAPRDEVEATLAGLWAEVLGRERVGIHDNFFTLGGDSIQSLQVIARANQRGIKLTPKQLFERPTVAAAAAVAVVAAREAKGPAPVPAPEPAPVPAPAPAPPAPAPAPAPDFELTGLSPEALDRVLKDRSGLEAAYPLSPTQEGMLFHTLMNPGSGVYLMQQHYVWRGELDVELVARAWGRVAERHPMLRTSFLWKDLDRPLQLVHKKVDLSDVIQAFDWRHLGEAEQAARLDEMLAEELARGLDMARAPLMRIRLIRSADDAYRIVRSFHHILTDDWCFSILMMDCLSYYAAMREGKALELPAPRPYRDYIAWLLRQDLGAAERFWRRELEGVSAPTPLGVERHGAGEQRAPEGIADAFAELSPEASGAIVGLSQRHGLTPNTFVQGAWALLLARYGGRQNVTFGVTVAGRPTELPGVETIVGLFINTLPLRVQIEPERPLLEWLAGVLAHNYKIREYEYPPLVQIQQWSELPKGQSLFKSLVVFENAPQDPRLGQQVGDVSLSFDQDRVHTNYPITVVAYPRANLGLRLSYDPRFFEADAARRMALHLRNLLEDMARRPDAKLGDLTMLSEAERRQLLVDWHESSAPSPGPEGYVALFEAQARKTPEAVAVSCGRRSLAYAGLNREANRVAHALRAEGVRTDDLVAVFETRDIGLLASALGALKAGGAYLPLDTAHPDGRIAHVIASARPAAVVTSEEWAGRLSQVLAGLPAGERPRVVVRERAPQGPAFEGNPPGGAGPRNLAYVIYTSGSTGQPKGAMIEHRGMLNNVWGKIPALGLTPADVIGQTASPCFDISIWQLLTGPLCGARVHIVPDEAAKDPRRLLEEAETQGITILELVPSLLREIVEAEGAPLAGLRWMLPTGEALTPELCRLWFERYPAVPLMNAYGPAECSDDVALHALRAPLAPERTHVPIGRPVADTRLHVVAGDFIAPVGVTGELWAGGVGVGRGYLNDPARTAEAFVPDPFSGEPGARLYRTGDLARRLPDGTLECLGRQDDQVKVRGYRIELGEIEATLVRHPQVREAAVMAREGRSGGKQLVAYVAGDRAEAPPPERLREFLKDTLPDYMVPSVFVLLDALPLTPNGKIDRKALPEPALASGSDATAPRTATEDVLAGVWAEVLGLERVGVHQGFFELGGHSLLAMQVVSRVRRALGVELPLRSVFDHPTVAKLARDVELRRAGPAAEGRPIVPLPRGGPLPMSFAQQRLWFLSRLEPDSPEYNVTLPVRASGGLDIALLEASFEALVRRHEALRTTYATVDGEPVQIVAEGPGVGFESLDLSGLPAEGREAEARRAAEAFAARPFDLMRGPPARALAVALGGGEHLLVLSIHHIATDGWSMNLLISELAELYVAARSGRPPSLRPLSAQYADFAAWQRESMRGPAREAQLAYWRSRLAGHPGSIDLRPDRPRAAADYRGARHEVQLDGGLTSALRSLAKGEGATLFMALLAAFKVLLFARSGQTDLSVGTDVAGRGREETEGLVGFFVNLLVLRSDLGGSPTFRELLAQVRETTLGAYAHQDLPFEQVVDALRPEREPGRHPLVQALFVLQNMPAKGVELEGLRFSTVDLDWQASRFDLGVFAEENDEGLLCSFHYRTCLFDASTVKAMAEQFVATLGAVVRAPEARVVALADAERKARLAQSRAEAEGKLKGLRRAAPRPSKAEAPRLVSAEPFGEGPLPLVVRPTVDDVDLAAWAREERAQIEAWLSRHGALLFRGFRLPGVADFERVAQAVCGELFGEYGDLPREKSGQNVYGSTPYPADKAILFHNESSHLPKWPLKQWFFCVKASAEGGATPLSDCRRAHAELDPDLRERLRRLGLLYVRNFTPGFDVSWQDFFRTEDPKAVEAHCRSVGMGFEWAEGGRLRVTQRGPAVVAHPKTKEWVFFNQIQLHHPAYLEAPVRQSLLAMLGEAWLPRNVLYGDGTPIDDETTRALGELYERCAVRPPWRDGDLMLLDNMLVAHGRDPFSGPRKIVVAMGEMTTLAACEGAEA